MLLSLLSRCVREWECKPWHLPAPPTSRQFQQVSWPCSRVGSFIFWLFFETTAFFFFPVSQDIWGCCKLGIQGSLKQQVGYYTQTLSSPCHQVGVGMQTVTLISLSDLERVPLAPPPYGRGLGWVLLPLYSSLHFKL